VKQFLSRGVFARTLFIGGIFLLCPDSYALEIGDPAPDFLLPATDGKTYSLKDFAHAKVICVIFTCNHCPTSQAYEDRLIAISHDYAPRDMVVIAISPNDPLAFRVDELGYSAVEDTLDGMRLRASRKGFPFTYLYDGTDQNASRSYGPRVTPHAFVFGKDRRLRYTGRIDNAVDPANANLRDLRSAIDQVLVGKKIRAPTTKVFGCPIKWASRRELAGKDLVRLNRETVSLKPLDDDTLSFLLSNRSKLLKLFFVWSPGATSNKKDFPRLVEIHRRYRKRGLDIITIAAKSNLDEKVSLDFLREQHASCHNYFIDGQAVPLFKKLGAEEDVFPFIMLMKPGGEVSYRRAGSLDAMELKLAILHVLGRSFNR
jgi:thiol-disulfide isomerase/thioredoxin